MSYDHSLVVLYLVAAWRMCLDGWDGLHDLRTTGPVSDACCWPLGHFFFEPWQSRYTMIIGVEWPVFCFSALACFKRSCDCGCLRGACSSSWPEGGNNDWMAMIEIDAPKGGSAPVCIPNALNMRSVAMHQPTEKPSMP
ncbi:hypothetical protein F5Y15DRAFT_384154 [Xylariaceae sp. FL0016]|nr:hypothetical protein F5Y15DRAFT_384154 [Xylariaceae sp. FL0016]